MTALEKVQRLYANYLEQARQAEREQKRLDGILGLGPRDSDAPCHERFSTALEVLLNTLAEARLESGEIREVLAYIYQAPQKEQVPAAAYWMLIAVHSQTLELVKQLAQEDAAVLQKQYSRAYHRRERLPAQTQVLAALERVQ